MIQYNHYRWSEGGDKSRQSNTTNSKLKIASDFIHKYHPQKLSHVSWKEPPAPYVPQKSSHRKSYLKWVRYVHDIPFQQGFELEPEGRRRHHIYNLTYPRNNSLLPMNFCLHRKWIQVLSESLPGWSIYPHLTTKIRPGKIKVGLTISLKVWGPHGNASGAIRQLGSTRPQAAVFSDLLGHQAETAVATLVSKILSKAP